jgi:hypothetical protein
MLASRVKSWTSNLWRYCSLVPLLMLCSVGLSAAELGDSLTRGASFNVYQFAPTPGGRFHVVMRSQDFEPYLMVIRPDGSVLTNYDHSIPGLRQSGDDAGIAVSDAERGHLDAHCDHVRSWNER